MSAFDVFKEPFSLLQKDGTKVSIRAIFNRGKGGRLSLNIEETELLLEKGERITRQLPNGREEHYIIEKVEFNRGFSAIPDSYQVFVSEA